MPCELGADLLAYSAGLVTEVSSILGAMQPELEDLVLPGRQDKKKVNSAVPMVQCRAYVGPFAIV